MTPISNRDGQNLTDAQRNYNRRFRLERMIIERCIGVIKMRFRCILNERRLRYHPTKASRIFISCVVLHNLLILNGIDPMFDFAAGEIDNFMRIQRQNQMHVQFQNQNEPTQRDLQRQAIERQQFLVNHLNDLNNQ